MKSFKGIRVAKIGDPALYEGKELTDGKGRVVGVLRNAKREGPYITADFIITDEEWFLSEKVLRGLPVETGPLV